MEAGEYKNLITILGPTATGKTDLAVQVAAALDAEIISADSRQVYKGMDLGTGKDLASYKYKGKDIPYHLINIEEAGRHYNVHAYVKDFQKAYNTITSRGNKVVLCGGSGMYIEAILKGYKLIDVPENKKLREEFSAFSKKELTDKLKSMKKLHNTTDVSSIERLVRAIEIEMFYQKQGVAQRSRPVEEAVIFGLNFPRDILRQRITERLTQRLEDGMVDEVARLIESGVAPETMKYYGLEYKFITMYLLKEIDYGSMFKLLNTAIHQFAKRQMTWFRRMEKQGFTISWIDGRNPMPEKVNYILSRVK